LFPVNHWTVSKIAFHKEDHLLVANQHVVAAHDIEPSLYRVLHPPFVFVGSHTRGRDWRRDSGDKGFGVGGYEVLSKLHEFRVEPADIAELGGAELGQIGLSWGQWMVLRRMDGI
jgi:hypothetical protein